jgi:glycosyltransferase involved in cell wall biosynthesis
LNILHIIDHFYPKLGYQETFLAKEHGYQYNTLVITSNQFEKRIFESNKALLKRRVLEPGFYSEEGVEVLRLPALFDNPPFNKPWLIGLEHAVISFKPDVIIIHGVINFSFIRIAKLKKKLWGTKLIVDDHMTFNATRGNLVLPLYGLFKRMFTPLLLNSVDCFVAVTYETKKFMQEIYGIPGERIIVIPLGVDMSSFHYDPSARKDIRRKYHIPETSVVFAYAGKVIPEKGVHFLVKAGISLCKKNEDVMFLIIGGKDKPYFGSLLKIIEQAGMNNQFIFIDVVPNSELYKYYSAADVGVWPLQCSISMLEATSCGLPIIISDKSGALERISKGNGIAYKEGDVIDLERKMSLLLDDELRNSMRQRAYEYVKEIDWKIIAQQFLCACEKPRINTSTELYNGKN